MSFPNVVYGREAETFFDSTNQGAPVGTKMIIEDGRAYRYGQADSTALVAALMNSGPIAEIAKYGDQACAAAAVKDTIITAVAAATTDMGIDQLINGYVWSEQTTQLGPASRIKSNTLITQGAETGTITLYEGLPIAIGGSDTISYVRNTYQNVIIHATSSAAEVAGVTVCSVAASEYAWFQVHGPCKLQTSGTPVVGSLITAVGTGAGEITVAAAATDVFVGRYISWEQANEDGLFFLTIE